MIDNIEDYVGKTEGYVEGAKKNTQETVILHNKTRKVCQYSHFHHYLLFVDSRLKSVHVLSSP